MEQSYKEDIIVEVRVRRQKEKKKAKTEICDEVKSHNEKTGMSPMEEEKRKRDVWEARVKYVTDDWKWGPLHRR